MVHSVINIGRWVIDFLFATDRYDIDGVLSCLYDCGASMTTMDEAESLMKDHKRDKGFSYSNPKTKRGIVVVGPSSSGAEFINTLVHEIRHVADAIAKSIGYQLDGELPAYVSGEAAMELVDVICEFGCRR